MESDSIESGYVGDLDADNEEERNTKPMTHIVQR